VLLVEDDVVLSELVTTLVEGAGYQAVTIADHDQIGEAIDRFDPKCVILDGEIGRTGLSRARGTTRPPSGALTRHSRS
jgi:DNA-binding response OmpR family regulator